MENKIFFQLQGVVEHRDQKSCPQKTVLGQFMDNTGHKISFQDKIISCTRTTT
jgi:hypothetical protein